MDGKKFFVCINYNIQIDDDTKEDGLGDIADEVDFYLTYHRDLDSVAEAFDNAVCETSGSYQEILPLTFEQMDNIIAHYQEFKQKHQQDLIS